MKIVMLLDFFGEDCAYQENLLTQYYQKMGHQVTLICSTFESPFDYYAEKYNRKIKGKEFYYKGGLVIRLRYSMNILNKLRRYAGVYNILKKENPDLIYAHGIHLNLREAAKYVKRYPQCKIIMDNHADFSNSSKNWVSLNILHKIIRKTFFNRYKKYISKIFPVVPDGGRFLHEVYDVPYEKMELLPLGCDYDLCCKIRENIDDEAIRKQFGIKDGDIVLITGGKFNRLKKTHLLIEAIKILNLPQLHLIIFGKAETGFEDYELMIRKESINQNIHFTGWVRPEKSFELMAIADIAVFPSAQSALWQQAIGMHLPLLVGDIGGQEILYLNQNNNLIKLEKENVNSANFAKELKYLIENPEILNSMKEGAEKTAKEYLDYGIIVKKTLEVLHDDNLANK